MAIDKRLSSTAARVRLAAIVILVLGWLTAGVVYAVSPGDGETGADGYRIVGGQAYAADASSRELMQLERLGGKAAVLTFRFNRWFVSLWSGRPLAWTLAVLAALAALVCWHVAALMDEARPPP